MKSLISIGLAAGLALSLATAAKASPVTLVYTGQDFTTVTGSYTTSDKVTGTIDLASPLGDNLSLASVSPSSFSFSDGVQTITSADSLGTEVIEFSTNNSGLITGWAIFLETPSLNSIQTNVSGDRGEFDDSLGETGVQGSWPGQEASTSTPEPLTLSLFGAGLLGAAAMRRRKAK